MSLAPNLNTRVECLEELQSAANEAHRLAVVQPWLLPKTRLLIDSIVALLDDGAAQVTHYSQCLIEIVSACESKVGAWELTVSFYELLVSA